MHVNRNLNPKNRHFNDLMNKLEFLGPTLGRHQKCHAMQEVLIRQLGRYSVNVNLHPNYPVKNIFSSITIHETRRITSLGVVSVPGGEHYNHAGKP